MKIIFKIHNKNGKDSNFLNKRINIRIIYFKYIYLLQYKHVYFLRKGNHVGNRETESSKSL